MKKLKNLWFLQKIKKKSNFRSVEELLKNFSKIKKLFNNYQTKKQKKKLI